jgi:hypothetical protein
MYWVARIIFVLLVLFSGVFLSLDNRHHITIEGNSPDPQLAQWIQLELLPHMTDRRIIWDGKIIFTDLPPSERGNVSIFYAPFNTTYFHHIHIDEGWSITDIRMIVAKELLGTYGFRSWWFDNSSYIKWNDPELTSLADGMAHFYVAKYLNVILEPNIEPWDGLSMPSCSHLYTIKEMHSQNVLAGIGVNNLLAKYCISSGSIH